MDLYTAIRKDHAEIKRLIEALAAGAGASGFEQLRAALHDHTMAEESVLYSRLESSPEARPQVLKCYEEHRLGDAIMRELDLMDCADERFRAKIAVYADVMDRHIAQEESAVFGHAQRLTADQAEELGLQYEARKTSVRNCCYSPRR